MPISVAPLRLNYSFHANRRGATDRVDAESLDEAFTLVIDKLNELILAMNATTRDDDSLDDECIDARCLSDDALNEISGLVNAAVTPE
jgi:hypothetical protein